jgi:UDP-galactopyranose mutase
MDQQSTRVGSGSSDASTMTVAIVGAGFAGAVLAHELAKSGKFKIEVFEERQHIGGNCYTFRDGKTGIMVHEYGPHIFNTSFEDVWAYINQFASFGPYINRVKAITKRGVFSLPVNLLTINQFFHKTMSPAEAQKFIASIADTTIAEPVSFEEQALKFVGRDLYENFFYGYTKKQWGVDPSELPASILQRLPVRFNYDDNYYNQKYQGIPYDGYTPIIEKMLDHKAIQVFLQQKFNPQLSHTYAHVFYSGPLDAYFNYKLGRLKYRTLQFERFEEKGDFQGNAVINYCEESVPFTRITEHKHFTPWEQHEDTICFREYSKLMEPDDTPYYPLRLTQDKVLLKKYVDEAAKTPKVTFIGRLGTYRYLDMHMVIKESLELSRIILSTSQEDWPKFSGKPL